MSVARPKALRAAFLLIAIVSLVPFAQGFAQSATPATPTTLTTPPANGGPAPSTQTPAANNPPPATSTPATPRLGGYVQARETLAHGTGLTAILNRARFSLDGALPSKFSYRFLVELEAPATRTTPSTPSLREANVRWAPNAFAVTAGQFKTPFSREYLLPIPTLETADFAAVVDSLSPKYDLGVMGEYAPRPWVSVSAGAFNGEGQNASANRDSTLLGVGRVVFRPIAEVAVGGSLALDSSDSLRWGGEANLEYRGATVRGEYIRRHVDGRASDLEDRGWYVLGLYRVLPIVQLQFRQEDFQRPFYGIARRVQGTTVGVNLDLVPQRIRLLINGTNKATGAAQLHAHALIAQLQARF